MPLKKLTSNGRNGDTQANIGYEEKLSKAADTLRGAMDAAEYKHVVLGLTPAMAPQTVRAKGPPRPHWQERPGTARPHNVHASRVRHARN